jgi:hypothetical protein
MKPETTPPVQPVASPPAEGPPPSDPQHTLDPPVPEEIIDEWRWIFKGRDEGRFAEYAGQHIAVYGQKVLASGRDPDLLREEVARAHQIDPERLVVAYIDRW